MQRVDANRASEAALLDVVPLCILECDGNGSRDLGIYFRDLTASGVHAVTVEVDAYGYQMESVPRLPKALVAGGEYSARARASAMSRPLTWGLSL